MSKVIAGIARNGTLIWKSILLKRRQFNKDTIYFPEHGKTCPTEITEAISGINAKGRPIRKLMHVQSTYRMYEVVGLEEHFVAEQMHVLLVVLRMLEQTFSKGVYAYRATTR